MKTTHYLLETHAGEKGQKLNARAHQSHSFVERGGSDVTWFGGIYSDSHFLFLDFLVIIYFATEGCVWLPIESGGR